MTDPFIPYEFSRIILTTANFIQIIESLDSAINEKDIISARESYGRDVLVYLWYEYLGDGIKARIKGFFEF